MRYSPSTNGFYAENLEYPNLPEDIIPVSDDLYHQLLDGQAVGKIITPNGTDLPYLTENVTDYVAIAEVEKSKRRGVADAEIAWRQDAVEADIATENEARLLADWRKYRVSLMRVDTSNPDWPEPPVD